MPTSQPVGASSRISWLRRLLSLRALWMLGRNTVVSCVAFSLGLVILWLMVQRMDANHYLAAAVSFIVSNSSHYWLGRNWIFAGSSRGLATGYMLFFVNAGLGLAVTMALFALLTEMGGMHYLLARIVASVFAGLAIFATNALLNFKTL